MKKIPKNDHPNFPNHTECCNQVERLKPKHLLKKIFKIPMDDIEHISGAAGALINAQMKAGEIPQEPDWDLSTRKGNFITLRNINGVLGRVRIVWYPTYHFIKRMRPEP